MPDAPVRIVDWYRADQGPRMRRVLLAGPAVLTLGGLVIAVSFAGRYSTDLRIAAIVAGLGLVASGAAFTAAAMYAILRQDAYVAIRTDGLALAGASASAPLETLVAWDTIAGARWDAARQEVQVERTEGAPVVITRRFARVSGPDLAHRIEQARRRAAMGLLR
jgi:hypothetical protein